jgi:hypothetical protein
MFAFMIVILRRDGAQISAAYCGCLARGISWVVHDNLLQSIAAPSDGGGQQEVTIRLMTFRSLKAD